MAKSRPDIPSLFGLYVRNYIANLAGNLLIMLLNIFTPIGFFKEWQNFLFQKDGWILLVCLIPAIFVLAGVLQYWVQRPISRLLKQTRLGEESDAELQNMAKRRLLNLPLDLGVLNLILWVAVTFIFMPVLRIVAEAGAITCLYIFFRGVIIGLMASFIAFFLIDDYARKKLVPWLFPAGRLATVPGTVRISILRRIRVLYGAGTGAPMLILIGSLLLLLWEMEDTVVSATVFGKDIFIFVAVLYAIFVAIALGLNFLVARSILEPIKDMMGAVRKIRQGDLSNKVRVVTNDELGVLGDGLNEMTEGLIERDRMRRSLNLAQEVQQALLPRTNPRIEGLDIATAIVYCDETGGDYYDFIGGSGPDARKLSVVVGDVSGHGVSSALLMASARAFLRQRAALPGSIAAIVSDVNRHLTRDVEESGGFMTLFYLTIDAEERKLRWVRAGHDPAILYDPVTKTFKELRGEGMALGVDAKEQYQEYERKNLNKDQIIILGTDGIWEARNPQGKMFGKDLIYQIIRQNSHAGAKEILTTCFHAFNRFLGEREPEDDVTMIVIKITQV